ncbi:MAG: hypothetical protein ABIQ18_16840 [Umezawaea sp.]
MTGGGDTSTDGAETIGRCSLLGLVLAGVTNAVVAVLDAVTWAWWTAGTCLLVTLVLGVAWSGPEGERATRRGYEAHPVVGVRSSCDIKQCPSCCLGEDGLGHTGVATLN